MGEAFGWDLSGAQADGRLVISYVAMGDLDLDVLANSVRMNLDERPISRIAIDSLAELVLADREWDRFPAYMRSLVGLVRAAGVSFLATSETAGGAITSQSLEGLMFLFDNVFDLRYIEEPSRAGSRAQHCQDAEPRARDDPEPGHHHRRRAHRRRQARGSYRTTRVERPANPGSALRRPRIRPGRSGW